MVSGVINYKLILPIANSEFRTVKYIGIILSLQNELINKDNIPYDQITKFIFERTDNVLLDEETINYNIDYLLNQFGVTSPDYSIVEDKLLKIQRHFLLAIYQQRFVLKQVEDSKKIIDDIEVTKNKLSKDIEELEEEANNIKETKSNIYTDIIALFGIFSAIVLLGFGGIDFTRAIFDVGSDVLNTPVKKFVSIGCLMLIVILTIVYSLLMWIGRLTHKRFGYCMSEKCPNGICKHKWLHSLMRHSFYSVLMLVLIVLFCIFK